MRTREAMLVLAMAVMSTANALAADAGVAKAGGPNVPAPNAPAPDAGVSGRIDAVTVYRGQALVTRVVDAPGRAGLREIVVTNLPERVVPSSLFVEADSGVEVRGLRFRTRPVSESVREDVRKLEGQLQDLGDKHAANERYRQLRGERKNYLDKLDNFSAPTAVTELTRGVLNAETLKTLTLFVFDQRKALADEELKLAQDARDTDQQIELSRRQLADLTRGASKSVREAVVFADFKGANAPLRIKYLVDSATWSPSYVARADAGGDGHRPVTVQYNASVQQMSGEDWTDVAMTLSTATPSLVAAAPRLDPLTITLAAGVAPSAAADHDGDGREDYAAAKQKLSRQRAQIEMLRNSAKGPVAGNNLFGGSGGAGQDQRQAGGLADSARQDEELNGVAGKLQVLELQSKDAASRRGPGPTPTDQEGVSVTYALPARTSLPSRSDQQSIRIASVVSDGEFYKLAMPVLTSYVYDHAQAVNPGPIVLLAGPVASYLDGQYVGVGTLPTVAVGERFTVGFGIDSSLRASRELVDKSETTQGGNRVLTFSYKLSVENFGKQPATVRVTDRLPTSPDPDVKVTLVSTTSQPTTQPIAEQANAAAKRTGVINWLITAAAESFGEKAATLGYQYRLEFDKQLNIAGLSEK